MTLLLAEFDWNALFDLPKIVFLAGAIIALGAIIAPQWRKVVQSRNETRLKEKMIERGFPADEIERVTRVEANGEADDKHSG